MWGPWRSLQILLRLPEQYWNTDILKNCTLHALTVLLKDKWALPTQLFNILPKWRGSIGNYEQIQYIHKLLKATQWVYSAQQWKLTADTVKGLQHLLLVSPHEIPVFAKWIISSYTLASLFALIAPNHLKAYRVSYFWSTVLWDRVK